MLDVAQSVRGKNIMIVTRKKFKNQFKLTIAASGEVSQFCLHPDHSCGVLNELKGRAIIEAD